MIKWGYFKQLGDVWNDIFMRHSRRYCKTSKQIYNFCHLDQTADLFDGQFAKLVSKPTNKQINENIYIIRK